ncbi:MAG: endonuclease/exonuclease/phosphatase family protein [Bifidobacterium sp.]|jgi:endonuclease/exonuclease/phosphatase family metal-dependent hydrolase|nr:endonuclease/exonuclease/phosphatase family protein [Bifidobacterium sp.]
MISWLLPAALLIVAAWAALRFLPAGTEARGVLPYLIALTPFSWIPAAAIAVWTLAAQQWWVACVGFALTALIAAIERQTYHNTAVSPATANAENTTAIQVMTLNCRYGRASAQAIVQMVRREHIQVLALQELSEDLVGRLNDAGLRETLAYCSIGTPTNDDNGGFNGVWSQLKPTQTSSSSVAIPGAEVPCLTIAIGGNSTMQNASVTTLTVGGYEDQQNRHTSQASTIRFFSAHPKSPMRGTRQWSAGVIGLARLLSDAPNPAMPDAHAARHDASDIGQKAKATVIMGDLNSHIDHPSFRRLLRAGFQDANRQAPNGSVASFPRFLPWPRIELDHILTAPANIISATGAHAEQIPGSDHLALTATVHVQSAPFTQ